MVTVFATLDEGVPIEISLEVEFQLIGSDREVRRRIQDARNRAVSPLSHLSGHYRPQQGPTDVVVGVSPRPPISGPSRPTISDSPLVTLGTASAAGTTGAPDVMLQTAIDREHASAEYNSAG